MYCFSQYRCIAREYARANGVAAHCVDQLKKNYESFETIQVETVVRISKKPFFKALLDEQAQVLKESQVDSEKQVESRRAMESAEGVSRVKHELLLGIRDAVDQRQDLEKCLKAYKTWATAR